MGQTGEMRAVPIISLSSEKTGHHLLHLPSDEAEEMSGVLCCGG
jgi:hypothetical protein